MLYFAVSRLGRRICPPSRGRGRRRLEGRTIVSLFLRDRGRLCGDDRAITATRARECQCNRDTQIHPGYSIRLRYCRHRRRFVTPLSPFDPANASRDSASPASVLLLVLWRLPPRLVSPLTLAPFPLRTRLATRARARRLPFFASYPRHDQ